MINKRSGVGNRRFYYFNDGEKLEIFHIQNNNKCQGILPTNMLASLEIHSSSFSNLYMEDIADMICQLGLFTFLAIIY